MFSFESFRTIITCILQNKLKDFRILISVHYKKTPKLLLSVFTYVLWKLCYWLWSAPVFEGKKKFPRFLQLETSLSKSWKKSSKVTQHVPEAARLGKEGWSYTAIDMGVQQPDTVLNSFEAVLNYVWDEAMLSCQRDMNNFLLSLLNIEELY